MLYKAVMASEQDSHDFKEIIDHYVKVDSERVVIDTEKDAYIKNIEDNLEEWKKDYESLKIKMQERIEELEAHIQSLS